MANRISKFWMASPSYPGSRSMKSPYPWFELGISSLSDGWSLDIKIFFGIVVVVVVVVTVVDGEVVVVEVVVEEVVLVIVVSIIVSSPELSTPYWTYCKKKYED